MQQEIDPLQINRVLKIKFSTIPQYDDWDLRVVHDDQNRFWNWSYELFDAEDKRDTEFYHVFKRKNGNAVEQYLANYMALYESIRDRGFVDQTEGLPCVHPHNDKRVSVAVDRCGNYVLVHGRHRLAVVKHLGLTSIPVDIKVPCNQTKLF